MQKQAYGAVNLIFVTQPLAAILQPLIGSSAIYPYAKGACFLIMVAGTIVGFLYQTSQTKYEAVFFENKVKLNNIKLILKEISQDIQNEKFKNRNFLLVSTNYDVNSPDAIAQFGKINDISYNESNYGKTYFDKINEEKIKPLLETIEKGHFCTYENANYDTELRDVLKKSSKVTVPIGLLSDAYMLLKKYKPEVLNYVNFGELGAHVGEFVRNHREAILAVGATKFFGALFAFFNGETFKSDTAESINNLLETGAKTITILTDPKSTATPTPQTITPTPQITPNNNNDDTPL